MNDKRPPKSEAPAAPVRLSAPKTAQTIMIAMAVIAALVLLPLTLLGGGAGESARRFASGSVAALGLYALLAGSLIACMIPRLRGVPRRVSTAPRPRLRAEPHTVVMPTPFDPPAAARTLKRAGYRHIEISERSVWGVKNRWSPMGTIVLHASLLLGVVGVGVAAIPGLETMTHAAALPGEALEGPNGSQPLTLARFAAEEGPEGTIDRLMAVVTTASGREVSVRPDLPALVGPVTAVTVEDFDVAASFSLLPTASAEPAYRHTAKLRLRSNASHDVATIDAGELGLYRVMVRRVHGAPETVLASVERLEQGEWRLVGPRSIYRRGELAELDGARLRFHGLEPYALLRMHRSPSAPLITLALLCAVAGACMRLVFPRREATVAAMDGGSGVTVVVDVYKGSRNESSRLALRLGEAS